MCPPPNKVKTKGMGKGSSNKETKKAPKSIKSFSHEGSMKRNPSLSEHIDVRYPDSWHDKNSTPNTSISPNQVKNKNLCTRMMKQIPEEFHLFVVDFVHVKGDEHCRFRCVAALLGMREDK